MHPVRAKQPRIVSTYFSTKTGDYRMVAAATTIDNTDQSTRFIHPEAMAINKYSTKFPQNTKYIAPVNIITAPLPMLIPVRNFC
jgi:hypothetical protein